MKTFLKFSKPMLWVGFFMLTMWACQNENADEPSMKTQSVTTARDNSQIVAATEDVMNITADAFNSEGFSSGRIAGDHHDDGDDDDNDDSGKCHPSVSGTFDLDRSHPDSLVYSGTLTIDFGDASTCGDSTHIRRGKIIDHYTIVISYKDSLTFSSTETITFEGFYKDSVQLDGTFIIKSSTGQPTTVEAQNAKITYADGTSFSWSGTLSYVYEKNGSRHCKGKTMKVTGSLSGTTRDGADFTATITKELVYKRGCFGKHFLVPVSGTIDVTTMGVTSTIDYGDGTCDKDFTITTAGVLTEHTFS